MPQLPFKFSNKSTAIVEMPLQKLCTPACFWWRARIFFAVLFNLLVCSWFCVNLSSPNSATLKYLPPPPFHLLCSFCLLSFAFSFPQQWVRNFVMCVCCHVSPHFFLSLLGCSCTSGAVQPVPRRCPFVLHLGSDGYPHPESLSSHKGRPQMHFGLVSNFQWRQSSHPNWKINVLLCFAAACSVSFPRLEPGWWGLWDAPH